MNQKVRLIAVNAVIAALYAAVTYAIAPLAYGQIQFRISEILIFLAFFNYRYIPGLILGCFLANLGSPMLAYDLVFGTLATAIAVTLIALAGRLPKMVPGLILSVLAGTIANALLVGFELTLAFGDPFIINALYVGAGEGAVLILGAVIFGLLSQIPSVRRVLDGTSLGLNPIKGTA